MYPDVHLLERGDYVTVGEVREPRILPYAHEGHLILLEPCGSFTMASFSSNPGDGKLHNHFTSSTKEKPGPLHNLPRRGHRGTTTKPTRRSPSKSNKLTVSHSNKSKGRAQHYARMQSKSTKKVLKSFSLKSHQSNKYYGGTREEEQWWRTTNDSKI